jgi:hypothetical protein
MLLTAGQPTARRPSESVGEGDKGDCPGSSVDAPLDATQQADDARLYSPACPASHSNTAAQTFANSRTRGRLLRSRT